MASSLTFCIIFLNAAVAVGPTTCSAKEFIVGDETGWGVGPDYQAWAKSKDFRVGDKLVFKYAAGVHNVFEVDETGFQKCIEPGGEGLSSGNDIINLTTPGGKWYLCGVGHGKHCALGQKLSITVKPAPNSVLEAPNSKH